MLHVAAESVIPLLALTALAAPALARRRGRLRGPAWRVWAAVALGVALVYAATGLDRALGWWAGHGLDFSTHTALAVALATSLGLVDARWLAAAVPLLCGYAALMVRLGYHTLADILTTVPVGAAAMAAAHGILRLRVRHACRAPGARTSPGEGTRGDRTR